MLRGGMIETKKGRQELKVTVSLSVQSYLEHIVTCDHTSSKAVALSGRSHVTVIQSAL